MHYLTRYLHQDSITFKTFLNAYLRIKKSKKVETNLKIMYDCLEKEQINSINFNCTEYFVNRNVLHVLTQISEHQNAYRSSIIKFIEDCVYILPPDVLSEMNTVKTLDNMFKSQHPLMLPLGVALCSRMAVNQDISYFYIDKNPFLIEFLIYFCFSGKEQDEYARMSLLHIYKSSGRFIVDYFEQKNYFKSTYISLTVFFVKLCQMMMKIYKILQKHFGLLELIIKKCEIHNVPTTFIKKLDFRFRKNKKMRLNTFTEIIINFKNVYIVQKLLSKILNYEYYQSNNENDLILFIKQILKNKQIKINCKKMKDCSIDVIHEIFKIMNKIANEKMNIDNIKLEKIKNEYKMNSKKKDLVLNFDLISYLIKKRIFDFEIYYILLLHNKMSFVTNFTKMQISGLFSKKTFFELWFCFS